MAETLHPQHTLPRSGVRRHLLRRLYDEDTAAALGAALDDRLAAFRATHPGRTRTGPPDAADAWLIAYPDHVREPDGLRSPLSCLSDLLQEHLHPQVTGVHTLPLHPASGDGGFSVVDFTTVDPDVGTDGDVRRLASRTSWMADAVINHVSARSEWFTGWLAGDEAYAGFFRTLDADVDTRAVTRPRTSPLRTPFVRPEGQEVGVWTTFSGDQVDLDYRTPGVVLAVVDVLLRYVAQGARAIRLDAVGFLWKDPATSSINLPQTHLLVQLLRACLDEVDHGLLLVTETNVPHEQNVSYFGLDGEREAQGVYQFALPPLTLHAFLSGDATALRGWARDLWFPADGRVYLNFLASHDGIGMRAAEGLLDDDQRSTLVDATLRAGGVVNQRTTPDGGEQPYELAVSWAAVLGHGHTREQALRRHLSSHALALALRGVPLLYLGSLLGAGNDVARYTETGHGRDLNRMRFDAGDLAERLADGSSQEARVLAGIRALLDLRRAHPAFHPDAAQRVHGDDPALVVVERLPGRGPRACVAVNVSAGDVTLELPPGRWIRLDTADRAVPGRLRAWENAWFTEA